VFASTRPRIARVLLLAGLSLFLARAGAASTAQATKPNVIVILADDLGYGELGCYGHPRFKTPNLDRMAAEGVRLTQFNTPMPFCAPTRAALLTGRYPLRCGLSTNPAPDGGPKADAVALPKSEITLAQIFKEAGYATGMVGKWHLGHKSPEQLPTHRGFDEYLGILYSNDMRPVRLIEGEKPVEYPLVQATLTRRYTERAVQFIERNRNSPFFLYFAHAMPHKPLACSEGFYKKSGAGLYGDVVAELDWSVGQVLAKLKELELDRRTLVLFTSDNGPWFGGSTDGLRGMKSTTWEGGFRVPCIARWPGRLKEGVVCPAPAVMMDLFATALAAAEIQPPQDRVIDGKSLLPLLSGQAHEIHDVVFGQHGPKLSTVRDARWKLHLLAPADTRPPATTSPWVDPRAPDGVTILAPYEQYQPSDYPGIRTGDLPRAMSLFDLENDPAEQHDVAAEHADVVARLKARAEQFVSSLAAHVDEIAVPDPSPSEPVMAVLTIRPARAAPGETVEALVRIRIAGAHFIHAKDDAGSPFVPLTMSATLPEGVEPVGEWQFPAPEKGRGKSLVYRDSVLLRRSLRVVSSSSPKTLTVAGELQYQVCTDELCWPKGKLKLSAPLMIQSPRR
jgi:N-acetylgalactosamine-6-sulfatase